MSAAFKHEFNSSLQLINEHRIHEAIAALDNLHPVTPAEHRMAGQLRAKMFMKQSLLVEAISCLKRTMAAWGEHVGLLADLAVCYYLKGDQLAWSQATDHLIRAFKEHAEQLSEDHYVRTAVLIGKFEEERGEVSSAIDIYESTLAHIESAPIDADDEDSRQIAVLITLAQLLRVRALYQPGARLGDLYLHLLKVSAPFTDLDIEVEHSLLQAELALVGAQSASDRLMKIVGRMECDQSDRNLALFDFIEGCLRRGESHDLSSLQEISSEYREPFEEALHRLAFDPDWEPGVGFIDEMVMRSSLANSLRVLTLICQKFHDRDFTGEVRRKTLLLMTGLKPESRALWLGHLEKSLGTENEIEIVVAKSTMKVSVDRKSASLGRKKNLLALLQALGREPELSLDNACRILWEAEYNESYYHRLRMQAQRLNEILFTVTERAKAIQVTSQGVRLDDGIRIKVK